MTNSKAFLDAVKKTGVKFNFLSTQIGLTPNGLRKKVHNKTEFKASEIQKCTKILALSNKERDVIFFA